MQGISYNTFSLDTLMHIFSFLPPRDKLKASYACRHWKQLQNRTDFWKLFFQRSDGAFPVPPEKYYSRQYLEEYLPQYRLLISIAKIHRLSNISPLSFSNRYCQNSNVIWDLSELKSNKRGFLLSPKEETTILNQKNYFEIRVKDLLVKDGEIGFFSTDTLIGTYIIKIFHLSNGTEISHIHLDRALSETQQFQYLAIWKQEDFWDVKGAFILEPDRLLIITAAGLFSLWDISNIFEPSPIRNLSVPPLDPTRKILQIFRKDRYLILHEQDAKETILRVYNWEQGKTIHQWKVKCDFPFITNGTFSFYVEKDTVHAIHYDEMKNAFSALWKKKVPEGMKMHEAIPVSPDHPYLLFTSESKSYLPSKMEVWNYRCKEKILNTSFETPLCPSIHSNCNLEHYGGPNCCAMKNVVDYKLIQNAVIGIARHAVYIWLLPCGVTRFFSLPDLKNTSHPLIKNFTNVFWDRGSLWVKYAPCEDSGTLDIYSAPSSPFTEEMQKVKIYRRSKSLRKFFIKNAITHTKRIPYYLMKEVFLVFQVLSLYPLWNPATLSRPLSERLTQSKKNLRHAVALPLFIVGKELGNLYGIIDPLQGMKILRFFQQEPFQDFG